MRRNRDITTRLRRTLRLFFLVPLLRGRRHPELAARATAVGLFWAFTPTFGLRMPLVFATWVTARHVLRLDFTLVIGLAFTWLTNALVTLPLYFGFYLTGRLLQDGPGELMNFQSFRTAFASLQAADISWLERLTRVLGDWGLTLWLGALPWALVMAGIGYVTASAYLRHRRPLRPAGLQPKLGR
ncbi:DUF2062 domain-containing protein [Dongia rigui]|uniref:DUF2062 domain-containing protein n=1 Tax=Dongia rigui TaxID=940149 RepID=A0ABU5E4V8_9PROT|nr:DUF2062 domain-containing protein [Dongia rigui]MDY0874482.1 DUF2062 domain-containing protein [Dongia rigui]